ncbi:MAG TPA: TylF/MycF/NovP-related O-methyltransferase [Chitinophagaceae bacterium]|nr:TylF/MycF/NovP-related O-methyltransferase [Chitinophagaceae bacterium]
MKKALKSFFNKSIIKTIYRERENGKFRFALNNLEYDLNLPSANYAPWLKDEEFQNIFSDVKENTLVDIYRCYELWELTESIHKLDPRASFIEIGVWRGGTAAITGRKLSLLKANCNFFLADTFTGVAKATEKDKYYKGGEHSDTSQETVEVLLKNKYDKVRILKGIFPEETAGLIPADERFGYCHIDVDVYQSAKDIVDWIWEKMIVGGVIIFDDYGFHTCDGITVYINEQRALTDRIIIHNLNGHAIMFKLR